MVSCLYWRAIFQKGEVSVWVGYFSKGEVSVWAPILNTHCRAHVSVWASISRTHCRAHVSHEARTHARTHALVGGLCTRGSPCMHGYQGLQYTGMCRVPDTHEPPHPTVTGSRHPGSRESRVRGQSPVYTLDLVTDMEISPTHTGHKPLLVCVPSLCIFQKGRCLYWRAIFQKKGGR